MKEENILNVLFIQIKFNIKFLGGNFIMKYRLGFITNSSSSSFIVSHNKTFTQKQKDVIANILISKLFSGSKVIDTEEEFIKWFKDEYHIDFDINEFIDEKGNFLFNVNDMDNFIDEYYSRENVSILCSDFLERILYALYDLKNGKVIRINNLERDEYVIEELLQDFIDELDDEGNSFRKIVNEY